MAQDPSRATSTDQNIGNIAIARKRFAENAISGALAMVNPWSNSPQSALDSMRLALAAARDSLGAPPLGKAAFRAHQPKLAQLAAAKTLALDEQLAQSPRTGAAIQVWRSILADCFFLAAEGLPPENTLSLTASGASWLAQTAASKFSITPEQARSVARSMCKSRNDKLAHAMAIMPSGEHLFSVFGVDAKPSSSIARTLVEETLSWKSSKAQTARFAKLLNPNDDYAWLPLQGRFSSIAWPGGSDAVLVDVFGALEKHSFDALSAYIFHAFASRDTQRQAGSSWAGAPDAAYISKEDVLTVLLACPQESFAGACESTSRLPLADSDCFCVALARLSTLPQALREPASNACFDWAQTLSARDPLWHAKPSPQSGTSPSKSLASNAVELVLRTGIQWKSTSKPAESRPLAGILEIAARQGFNPQSAPAGGLSTMEKLLASKNSDSRSWASRLEAIALGAAIAVPEAQARSKQRL